MRKIVGYGFLVLWLFASCTSQDDPKTLASELGYDYVPMGLGKAWIYQVDSTVYSQIHGDPDTTYHYQLKVVMDGSWTNAAGEPGWRIRRMVRDSDSAAWVNADIWGWVQTKKAFQATEENLMYVKLIFPFQSGQSWNGNQYNALKPWNYHYENIGQPMTVGGKSYPKTTTVVQADDSNFVYRTFAREIYAQNVGMIYKLVDTTMTQNGLKEGIRLEQTLLQYIP